MTGEAATTDKLKTHSPFMQVVLRKSGEAMDLGGKALIGLSGASHVLGDRSVQHLDLRWFSVVVAIGGAAVIFGIYLQAKAEETEQ